MLFCPLKIFSTFFLLKFSHKSILRKIVMKYRHNHFYRHSLIDAGWWPLQQASIRLCLSNFYTSYRTYFSYFIHLPFLWPFFQPFTLLLNFVYLTVLPTNCNYINYSVIDISFLWPSFHLFIFSGVSLQHIFGLISIILLITRPIIVIYINLVMVFNHVFHFLS